MDWLFKVLLFAALLAASAFFSAVEVAFLSVTRIKLKTFLKKKAAGAEAVARLKARPQNTIIAVLICNNVVNVSAAVLAANMAANALGSAGLGVAAGLTTLALLVFGEVIPKSLATVHVEKISLASAPLLETLSKILAPAIWFLEKTAELAPGYYSVPTHVKKFTEEELRNAVELGFEDRSITVDERKMIEAVLNFSDVTVKEVMTPANRVTPFRTTDVVGKCLRKAVAKGFPRYPVLDSQGKVVGTVSWRALAEYGTVSPNKPVGGFCKKPFFLSREESVFEAFKEMQEAGEHLAIVVNERGNFNGVASLEDFIEEVMGEVDAEKPKLGGQRHRASIVVSGDARLREVEKALAISFTDSSQFGSLAAFLHHELKRVPSPGDVVVHKGFKIVVQAVSDNTVTRAMVERL